MILLISLSVFAISIACRGTSVRNAAVLNLAVASGVEGEEKLIARAAADFRAEIETAVRARFDMNKADFFDSESGIALR